MTVAVFVFVLFGCAQPDSDPLPQDLIIDDTAAPAADSQEMPPAQPSAVAAATATPTVVEPTEHALENARQFDLSAAAILGANPGINPELLAPNQVLILPALVGTNPPRSLSNPSPAAESLQPATVSSQPSQVPTAIAPTTAATPTRRPIALLKPAAKLPQRYFAPPTWMLGPIQGSSEDDKFINEILYYLDQYNIPITVFHFDSDRWETCANNAEFKWSDALLQRMRSHTPPIRALFWILPLITRGCGEYGVAASRGYFVRNQDGSPLVTSGWQGTGSWIDFNNPQAVAYWHSLLDRIFSRAVGVMGGFYTDDLHADLPNGTAYSDAFVRDLMDYTRSKIPDGDVVMKSYGLNTPDNAFLSRYGHASYVNDLDSGFSGLREGIRRVLASSTLLPAPFNEFTGYSFRTPDSETYIRRLHWGAFQPIMENDSLPKNGVPWDSQYSPQVLQAYRYYSTLHWELVPFFHTYDGIAYQNNSPIFQQPNAARYSTVLGREIFVQYVTDYMQTINVTLPAGQWINYWNEQELHAGPTTIPYPVPPGREPIFIANGAIIPMQVRDGSTGHGTTASVGALTVNVFPSGHSTFSYFDSSGRWLLFDVKQTGKQVALCTSAPPSQPLIYRIARWPSPPARVTTLDGAVGVDSAWGTPLSPLGSEAAVDASGGGWFYDSARQHLIVKITKVGSYCP